MLFFETSNPFFSGSTFMVICLHLIKHVPLCFNTPVAPPVCILRAKLWKVDMKCKIVMLVDSFPFSKNLHFLGCDILSHPTVIQSTQLFQWWFESIRFKFLKKFFSL